MNSVIQNENPNFIETEEEKINFLKYNSNNDNLNDYQDEEYNLDIINQNIENNIESENNYDENLNLEYEQNDDDDNEEGQNEQEYLFEKIKDKLREEKYQDDENGDNNDNQDYPNMEINEEEKEKLPEIYDLPLSINMAQIKKYANNSKENNIDANENENNTKINKNTEILTKNGKEYKDEEYINNKESNFNELNIKNINENNKILNHNNTMNNLFIKNDINIDINNSENINIINKQLLNDFSPIVKSQSNINLSNYKIHSLKVPEGVKFGVDETGNPINISNFLNKEQNNENKIIAFIIQKEGENNYLIDIKGNTLEKTEDDYYLYKDGNENIIIKDFDIQHPELRVYGHRKIIFNNKNIENKKDNILKGSNTNEKSDNKEGKNKENIIIKSLNILDKKSIKKNKSENDIQNLSVRINNEDRKAKDNILLNNDLEDIILNSNSKNKSVIIKENRTDSFRNINDFYTIKSTRNNYFDEQMNIWRQRYGKNNNKNNNIYKYNNKTDYRNYSYRLIPRNKMINRTDSILKMASSKNENKIPINKNNYISSKSNLSKPTYLFNEYKNHLIQSNNNSFSTNIGNSLLKDPYKKIGYNIPKINLNIESKTIFQKYKRNNTLQSINNKYNSIIKDYNSHTYRNKNVKENIYSKIDNLLQNIDQKYKNKTKYNNLSNFNSLNNSKNSTKNKNLVYENDEIKKHNINNYIYNNLRKINENRFIKKNLSIKCSVLSNEANKLIKDFNIKQKRKEMEQIINKENINNYSSYMPLRTLNNNINLRKYNYSNYTYINRNQKQNENIIFDYQNSNINNNDYDNNKIEIKPSKKNNNRNEILNGKIFVDNIIKESSINNYYRKIKHNTSKNNYNFY